MVHQAARAVAHLRGAGPLGPGIPREPDEPHVAGRNLWTITDYSGVDPRSTPSRRTTSRAGDFESQAQVRYLTARLNVGF